MRSTLTTICLLVTAAWLQPVSADVYKYRDAQGHIYLTDKPMKGGYRLLKRFSLDKGRRAPVDSLAKMRKRKAALQPLIEATAARHSLPEALVHAVVRVESAYRSDAVSSKGAMGLMQLMPATATRFGVNNAYDARQNLDGGSRYLRLLLEQFDQNLSLALAAYNAGENAVARYGNQIPPFKETQAYVKKVLGFYRKHQAGDQIASR